MQLNNEQITFLRHNFTQNLLKNVLIRIDYSGVNDIDKWIQDHQKFMQKYFVNYARGVRNQAMLKLTSPEDIARTLSIPVEEVNKVTIHEFNQWKGKEEDMVTMLVTNYFMSINIRCNNYKCVDPYLLLAAEFIKSMYHKFGFFKVQRIGIRKISGKVFNNMGEISKIYKSNLFVSDSVNVEPSMVINRRYEDNFVLKDNTMKANCIRKFRLDNNKKLQVLLDFDCYIDQFNIMYNNYDINAKSLDIMTAINNFQFKLFLNSVQQEYITNKGVL